MKFRGHLQRHNVLGELPLPILCTAEGCKSSFVRIYNYVRHIMRYHGALEVESSVVSPDLSGIRNVRDEACVSPEGCECDDDDDDVIIDENCTSSLLEDLRSEGLSLVSGLRANSGVPYTVIPEVVQSFNQMSSTLSLIVQAETMNCLVSAGVNTDVINNVKMQLDNKLAEVKNPLDFLSNRYRQDKFFDTHPLA